MYFGEIALMTNLRRTSTVISINNCFCGVISRKKFKELLSSNIDLKHSLMQKIQSYKDSGFTYLNSILKNVPYFRFLKSETIKKIIFKLKEFRMSEDQKLLATGENCDKIFFIK